MPNATEENNILNEDTVKLLRECDAGVKMGVDSINDVLDNVGDKDFKRLLTDNKEEHQKIGSEIHEILNRGNEETKPPKLMAKGMSWMKTNVMMMLDESDKTIADLMTDGCNMGVKSLNKYLNEYAAADERSKKLAKELIDLEHRLTLDMRKYL